MKLFVTLLLAVGIFHYSVQAENQYEPRVIKERITISVDGKFPMGRNLDVLFVVDNSGSMDLHQKNLEHQMDIFLDTFVKTAVGAHFGVVSTDQDKGLMGKLVGTPSYLTIGPNTSVQELRDRVLLGTQGGYMESVFGPTMTALSEPLVSTVNAGFYRRDARLALIYLTDAVDQSTHSAWGTANFLMTLKSGAMDLISVSALLATNSNPKCGKDDSSKEPEKIIEFARLLNGKTYDLCGDVKANVTDIAQRIVRGLSKEKYQPGRPLKEIILYTKPNLSSLEVTFGNQKILASQPGQPGWTYDAAKNMLSIDPDLQWEEQVPGTKILISFWPE